MNDFYEVREHNTFSKIAEKLNDFYSKDGTISERKRRTVIKELRKANPKVQEPMVIGQKITLPKIFKIQSSISTRLDTPEDYKNQTDEIIGRINQDNILGVLFLVDPIRVLNEIGFTVSDQLIQQIESSAIGITRTQRDQYDRIKEKGYVAGIKSVKLRRYDQPRTSRKHSERKTTSAEKTSKNPIGNFDTSIDIAENLIDTITKVAYDEGAYPHRIPIPADYALLGSEFVIGRPEKISLDTKPPNSIEVTIPFSVIQNSGNKVGKITMVAGAKIVEVKGNPDHLTINFGEIHSFTLDGKEFTETQKDGLKTLMQNYFNLKVKSIPLSPLIKEVADAGLEIDDIDYKVMKKSGVNKLNSLALCLNFDPNEGEGNIVDVQQFVKQNWAVGLNQRVLHDKFNNWWESTAASKYRRLSKDKMENYENLAKNNQMDQIFDSNGEVYIGGVHFTCENGYVSFNIDITVENQLLWIDCDAEVTGKLTFTLDPSNHNLLVTVKDVDTSVSALSKFLIGLFCAFLGFIAGGIIGAIVGGVVGGVVGVSIGATIGATFSAIMGFVIAGLVIPAIAEAIVEGKLEDMKDIKLFPLNYDWQVPDTSMVLKVWAEWLEVKPGEILLGGNVKTPPLISPSITISTESTTIEKPTDLPWAQLSGSQKQKLGGSPYYLVDTTINCSAQIDRGLEKPITYAWTMNNTSIEGDGDKATITIATSMGIAAKTTSATIPTEKGTASPNIQMAKTEFVQAVMVQETIQVTNKDGTKAPPYVLITAVPEPPAPIDDQIEIKASVTDALCNKADYSKTISVKLIGDVLQDFWEKEKIKYKAAVPIEEILPEPGPWLFINSKLPPEHESIRFSRPELVFNIAATRRISTANVLRSPLEKTKTNLV